MSWKIEMAGETFGQWHVLAEAGRRNGNVMWKCKCLGCRQTKIVAGHALRRGDTLSCGACAQKRSRAEGKSYWELRKAG
jgi:ribosomal protein S27E